MYVLEQDTIPQPPEGGIFLPETPLPTYLQHKVASLDEIRDASAEAKDTLAAILGNQEEVNKFREYTRNYIEWRNLFGGPCGYRDAVIGYIEGLLEQENAYSDIADAVSLHGIKAARSLILNRSDEWRFQNHQYEIYEHGPRRFLLRRDDADGRVLYDYYHGLPESHDRIAGVEDYRMLLMDLNAAVQDGTIVVGEQDAGAPEITGGQLARRAERALANKFHAFSFSFGLQYADLLFEGGGVFTPFKMKEPKETVAFYARDNSIFSDFEWRIGSFDVPTQSRQVLVCNVSHEQIWAIRVTVRPGQAALEEIVDASSAVDCILHAVESEELERIVDKRFAIREAGLQHAKEFGKQVLALRAGLPFTVIHGDKVPLNALRKPLVDAKLPKSAWITDTSLPSLLTRNDHLPGARLV